MRNTFLFLFLCCFAGSLSAQSFNRSIATADKAFVGEGTPVIAEGDINKDGIKDLVVAVPEVYQGKNSNEKSGVLHQKTPPDVCQTGFSVTPTGLKPVTF